MCKSMHLREWPFSPVQKLGCQLLEQLPRHLAADVNVIHQTLHIDGGLSIDAEDLLQLQDINKQLLAKLNRDSCSDV